MTEVPSSGVGDPSANGLHPDASLPSVGAKYKTMSPARLPISRSPCLTIPSGFSPSALLESPVLLTNMKVEPSPTTGSFAMPLIMNNVSSGPVCSPDVSSKSCIPDDGNSRNFEFRPHIRSTSRSGLSSLAPTASLGSNMQQQSLSETLQSQCETQGTSSFSLLVKTENISPSSHGLALSKTASDSSPDEFFSLKANAFTEDASNEFQQTTDADSPVPASHSDHNCFPSSNVMENTAEDGYNWRKYGQKHVKGSEFPRSYYKCTHPNCQMKKQLERSQDGQITEVIYRGRHEHPKPQPSRRLPVGAVFTGQAEERTHAFPSTANTEEKLSTAHGHASQHVSTNCNSELSPVSLSDDEIENEGGRSGLLGNEVVDDDDPESKRRKMEATAVEANSLAKNNREPRVVVQTVSEVDILDDGYRWRKYGQKVVKGNPNPRSYYKCTNLGCSVRKHVERAAHDPKAVITTYEGKHNHDVPVAKNGGNHEPSANLSRSSSSHHYSQSEENTAVNLHLGVGTNSNYNSSITEKQHHQLQYVGSDCSNVMIRANPMPKHGVVFSFGDGEGEVFSFGTQINSSSSHYCPRAGNLVMGP
ncbi:putative WRKY transcription factor 20 [Apostasia shenzhenica]|uniref:Putative WRKY transcription factor 20 n=1 Tax=Apostasia shenzhenica TaxID=1088818 RepID=A0A2I0AWK7_9ASPA|nr:putative WRKY transcription factor 20 [Apostasia shenzhenica]